MILEDRFTRGFIAGLIGGVGSLAWGLFSKSILKFTELLYTDFASILIYGNKASSFIEKAFAQFVVFGFWGLGGILFILLIPYLTSKNLIFKGAFWGAFIWFASYVITLLFKVKGLEIISVNTSISQLIGGLIWGGLLAIAIKYLDRKVKKL
ncbi:hypothetical protein [Desulfosporosinus sp.]|uniref:hypothetical protein n=1 Tax=Desulfosporosinus sp. TaxID=157907 RepID=UPI000E887E29|nr:hypothetical protein [Desulfosporosinus sp.]MBC2723128.1 hypothetical protein [Desulfosporosinus sp.]MBC2726090.1 hypothetical protein [Desulfosporosinus sp.]HBV86256.1 hypothetical protein [Desulfosporosinus sp.]